MNYQEFLSAKHKRAESSGIAPGAVHDSLYPFQSAVVRWAVKRGRAAVFADCGLGKTRIQIEWLRQMGARGLIVCPLAVAQQTIAEGKIIGVDITLAETPIDGPGMFITNYEKLHKFIGAQYGGIVLDESSILKSIDGKTRTMLLKEFTSIPHRLCCTATPAPNDIAEMANHAEFLGVMSRVEMLATFFVHDDAGWRLKGHAQDKFWEWMATWALYIRRPSDIGFEDDGFILPPLEIDSIMVESDYRPEGMLFSGMSGGGIGERAGLRKNTIAAKLDAAAALVKSNPGEWVIWCGLNSEADAIAGTLGVDAVNIEGADSDDQRMFKYARWRSGSARVLVTKPKIFGFGMNWQSCHQMMFFGLGDSWEQYYQAIRRCWRFGQEHPVKVWIVTSDAESMIVANIKRKEVDAETTAAGVVAKLRDIETAIVHDEEEVRDVYSESANAGEGWRTMLGDSCKRMAEIESDSVGLSVFSPPFASLYTYSASDRDLGNSKDYDQFFGHFGFIVADLLRITIPCRRACVHVQQVTTTKATHGQIGWRDFRADTVRLFQEKGWIYDGEVVIDKDPQAQAIRTKSKALMFVQKNKDSAWSRPAMADYILLFRKPGENPKPIKCDVTNEEWIHWARPVWYGIKESDTLNVRVAREDKDERHICPLQLETILRCVRLWSNPGELVMSPFMGIGSEGYVSVMNGRRFVGIELKPAYYAQAVKNIEHAARKKNAGTLFG